MLDDFHEAHFDEGRREEEEPEATAKAYYDMLAAAQQPFHGHTKVSQLDAIGRLMTLNLQPQSAASNDGPTEMSPSPMPQNVWPPPHWVTYMQQFQHPPPP